MTNSELESAVKEMDEAEITAPGTWPLQKVVAELARREVERKQFDRDVADSLGLAKP